MVAARSVNRCHRLSTTTSTFELVKRLLSQIICFVPWLAGAVRSKPSPAPNFSFGHRAQNAAERLDDKEIYSRQCQRSRKH